MCKENGSAQVKVSLAALIGLGGLLVGAMTVGFIQSPQDRSEYQSQTSDRFGELEKKITRLEGQISSLVGIIEDIRNDREQFQSMQMTLLNINHQIEMQNIRFQTLQQRVDSNTGNGWSYQDMINHAEMWGRANEGIDFPVQQRPSK